ncbi:MULTISPECIES: beta-ketoacyl-ACP synthase III [Rickettsieae]|uniref:beta-ketoacyl-ACP synthase III n=1 Tax=Rickettsieae TaxID=33988 RepID=UPI000B9A947B|nr:beta-ketoacyl-ACP synthase III [Rickettsia endosymbiont of Culicoides newsteadi]MDN3031365.1 beta-ketoacyl-ACP synthase III [Candidatus Tisiphia sp.]OZG31660.1 3-oxoacyl-ACP synthase III [Rickettsia endosymbiont of Culicoides newsteadi]
MTCKILGCGAYLPKRILSNAELSLSVDTNDEWIHSRTGILQRHIAADDEYTSHLAIKASQNAIDDAGLNPASIDLIITCTTTPDNSFPSTASKLQGYLGLGNVPSFDLQAVCSGFIYGLHVADSLIKSRKYKTILLVGAEKMSSLMDWSDRATCILFGDGAGAVILQYSDDNSGIIDSNIYSDGRYHDILYTDGGVSSNGKTGKIKMKGQEVFRHAVEKMSKIAEEILHNNNFTIDDVNHFIPHQANVRIIDAVVDRLKIDPSKVVKTVAKHANCSAASIPLALASLKSYGNIKKGDLLLFTAIGAGVTWGSALIRW